MRPGRLCAFAFLVTAVMPAFADERSDAADILAARKFAEPIMGRECEFKYDESGVPEGYNNVFHLTYRSNGQDQDSPDYRQTLIQLACYAGAYNFSSIYVMRDDDTGGWQVLTFAEPVADYDYTDEYFTKLKAPPTVTGWVTETQMTNSEFDPESKTITATPKGRGVGDTWSSGEWKFDAGFFVLKRYEIDPTQEVPEGREEAPNQPESYVLFGDPKPAEPEE